MPRTPPDDEIRAASPEPGDAVDALAAEGVPAGREDVTGTLAVLAQAVHAERRLRGWSLAALAARSGLSKGMLLQIEAARTNPSIGTLVRLSTALGIGLRQLFEGAESELEIVEREQGLVLWRSERGGTATLLVGGPAPQPVELWEWRLAPGDAYVADVHAAGTREVLHVRRGTLTLVLGERTAEIPAGASAVARTDRPHAYRNHGRGWLELTMVVVEPAASLRWATPRR